jgi:hypothetical protein
MSIKSARPSRLTFCKNFALYSSVIDLVVTVAAFAIQGALQSSAIVWSQSQLKIVLGVYMLSWVPGVFTFGQCFQMMDRSEEHFSDGALENVCIVALATIFLSLLWAIEGYSDIDVWYSGKNEHITDLYGPFKVLHWQRVAQLGMELFVFRRLSLRERTIISLAQD